MIKLVLLLVTFFSLISCSATNETETSALVVKEIIQGKMRKDGERWIVYEASDDMVYEINDQCTYNKKPIDCLRHGFRISYDSFGKDLKLNCVAKTNVTVSTGNVEREKNVDTNEDNFYLELKGTDKEFINVQYIVGSPGLKDLYIETSCSYYESQVVKFSQRVRF